MPSHFCIDPHDQYAQTEVLVEFKHEGDQVILISVFDLSGINIISDLEIVQRQILEREIILDYRQQAPRIDVPSYQASS